MPAFAQLDWTRFDVWAIVESEGVGVVDRTRRDACLAWLGRHGYAVDSIDFGQGIGPAVTALGSLFRWEQQFGYALGPGRCSLNALRDGFDFDMQPGQRRVLELLNPDPAYREDADWFLGLLSIAHEYSRNQLALGSRFFTLLALDPGSPLMGASYQSLSVRSPFWRPGADPFGPASAPEST